MRDQNSQDFQGRVRGARTPAFKLFMTGGSGLRKGKKKQKNLKMVAYQDKSDIYSRKPRTTFSLVADSLLYGERIVGHSPHKRSSIVISLCNHQETESKPKKTQNKKQKKACISCNPVYGGHFCLLGSRTPSKINN